MADDKEATLVSAIFTRILELEEKQAQRALSNRQLLNATRITDLINDLKTKCEALGKELTVDNSVHEKKLKEKEEFMKCYEDAKKRDFEKMKAKMSNEEDEDTDELDEPAGRTLEEKRHDFTAKFNAALKDITTGDYDDAAEAFESLVEIFALVLFCSAPDIACVTLVRSKLAQLLSGCTKQLANYLKATQQQADTISYCGKMLIIFDAQLLKSILDNAPFFELSRTLTPQLLSDLIEAMLPFIVFYENGSESCSTDTAFDKYDECFVVKMVFDLLELQESGDGGDDGTMRKPVVEPSTLVVATLKLLLKLAEPKSTIYADYQMTAEKMMNFAVKKVKALLKVAVMNVTRSKGQVQRREEILPILLHILDVHEYVDASDIRPELEKLLTYMNCKRLPMIPVSYSGSTYGPYATPGPYSGPTFGPNATPAPYSGSTFGPNATPAPYSGSTFSHYATPAPYSGSTFGPNATPVAYSGPTFSHYATPAPYSGSTFSHYATPAPYSGSTSGLNATPVLYSWPTFGPYTTPGPIPAPAFGANAPPPCPAADPPAKVISVEKQANESCISRIHQLKETLDQKEPFVRSLLDQVDPQQCQTMSNEELLQAVAKMRQDLAQQHKQIESISLMLMEEEEKKKEKENEWF